MTKALTQCPICGDQLQEAPISDIYRNIDCPTCGIYKISGTLVATLPNKTEIGTKEKAVFSHYIRQKNEAGEHPVFQGNLINRIVKTHSLPKLTEQIDNLILYLGQKTSIGEELSFTPSVLRALVGAIDDRNLEFVRTNLMQQGYMSFHHYSLGEEGALRLEMKGWERFYELEKGMVDRRLAFMAMPFGDDRLDEIYLKWFKPACKAVGFELRRVDERPEAGIINQELRRIA